MLNLDGTFQMKSQLCREKLASISTAFLDWTSVLPWLNAASNKHSVSCNLKKTQREKAEARACSKARLKPVIVEAILLPQPQSNQAHRCVPLWPDWRVLLLLRRAEIFKEKWGSSPQELGDSKVEIPKNEDFCLYQKLWWIREVIRGQSIASCAQVLGPPALHKPGCCALS